MNAIFHHDRERYVPPSMKGAVVTSSLFHVVLFILTAIGIPFIAKDPLIITTPINVEIIKIALDADFSLLH